MSGARVLLLPVALAAAIFAALGACNGGTGDCPAKETIQPGAACGDDDLQCAYDLTIASSACDGTTSVLASSCTCTKGTWACPDPSAFDCPSGDDGAAGDDGPSSGDDGPSSGDDGPSSGDDGPSSGDDGPSSGDDGPSTDAPSTETGGG